MGMAVGQVLLEDVHQAVRLQRRDRLQGAATHDVVPGVLLEDLTEFVQERGIAAGAAQGPHGLALG